MRREIQIACLTIGLIIFGDVLAGAAQRPAAETLTLTLPQAMELAIRNNLTSALARAQSEEARGLALQSAAALLPRLLGSASQSRIFKVNLAAQGFTGGALPGFDPLLGPFNSFDARLQLSQRIFDLSALRTRQSGRAQVEAARWQEQLAREQVATAAALAYLEELRTARSVAAAQANVALAQNLLELVRDQHRNGISTGVDLARGETRAANENVQLIRARVAASEAALRLRRVLGVPLSVNLVLADPLRATPLNLPDEEAAVGTARGQRVELRFYQERARADTLSARAAGALHWPAITAHGDYGFSGNVPEGSARTGSIGGNLSLPIYYGGEIDGRVKEARGRQLESQARYDDARSQVEEDVRLAMQTLTAEIEEVKTTALAVQLSERELKLARDRYANGVGDNIQLTTSQTALAQARDAEVDALARYNVARINLATALGDIEKFQL
jgi:outer membrane protein